jgi:hypothetical protein
MSSTLKAIVGDQPRFMKSVWGKQSEHFCDVAPELITSGQIWAEIECGLLTRHYVTAFRDSIRAPLSGITASRHVLNKTLDGFVTPAGIHSVFAAGNTLELSQLGHWHGPVQDFINSLTDFPGAEIQAAATLSPADVTGMAAHTGGAHTFILQTEGETNWIVADPGPDAPIDAIFMEVDDLPSMTITMRPRDVLYVPHGWPYRATACGSDSLHVAITVRYPSTQDVIDALSEELTRRVELSADLTSHHRFDPQAKSEQVITLLGRALTEIDAAELAQAAVARRIRAHP